jgi:hypothetical protein
MNPCRDVSIPSRESALLRLYGTVQVLLEMFRVFGSFDTAGEVIFAEASQSAAQLVEWAPSVGSGLFQTSPAVSVLVTEILERHHSYVGYRGPAWPSPLIHQRGVEPTRLRALHTRLPRRRRHALQQRRSPLHDHGIARRAHGRRAPPVTAPCSTAAGYTSPPLRGSHVGTVDTHRRDVSHFAIIFVEPGMIRPEPCLRPPDPTGVHQPGERRAR